MTALFGADWLVERFVDRTPNFSQLEDEANMATLDNVTAELLDEYGGWFELLHESGEVVAVFGNKEDDKNHYAQVELYALLDVWRNKDGIYYHAFPVEGDNGAAYTLLWKKPERLSSLYSFIGIFIGTFALLLLISLYFYTRYSVGQLKRPLQQITEGIREMEALNYRKRLHFSAEMEFAEIRDAFNKMAGRLEQISDEKEGVEANKRNMLLHLSHDLKTPITSMLGYSQLLLESGELGQEKRDRYVQYIHDKSRYMSQLIHNLFEFAKLEDDHFQMRLEKVNVTRWFQERVAEFYPEIERGGFSLDVRIPERPLFAALDKGHMQRVVDNLFGNALKYNQAGTALLASCTQENGKVVLRIGDNGAGIPASIRERVFDEFVSGTEIRNESTGLGLAICRKIVEHHRGRICLIDSEQYTTLFQMELPLLVE